MGTKLDQKFAKDIRDGVDALISEVERLEGIVERYEATKEQFVNRFLVWQLPKSVCSDFCVTEPNYPHSRTGTSLLTADEAGQLFEYLFKTGSQPAEKK